MLQKIRNNFNDPSLLELALTHRSWVNEHAGESGTNERLEFLGDAVLEFVVSDHIYREFSDKEEGFLTALRANIVNTKNLATLAERLEVGQDLKLSKGEEQGGGRNNASLLADLVEAIIGAIFLDQGFAEAEKFIKENLLHDLDVKLAQPLKDAKSRLQEAVQAKGLSAPKYKVVAEAGPDHDKEFTIEVSVEGKVLGEGKGKSKSAAEQEAAEAGLVNYS